MYKMDKLTSCVYINLDSREDRKENIIKQFDKINFTNYQRFSAIKTSFGGLGCCQSHRNVLEIFLENYYNNNSNINLNTNNIVLMILEDDAEFIVPRKTIDYYIEEFIKDESSYGMSLGFNPHIIHEYNDIFYRSLFIATASCYLIKIQLVPLLIDIFNESEKHLLLVKNENDPNYHKYAIDQYWTKLHREYLWLIPKKKCVEQYQNYSNIHNQIMSTRF